MAKMRFYYNGKLVRTSENHEYTHAVIYAPTGEAIGCRTSLKAAESFKSSEISGYRKGIENYKAAIRAIESGKTYIMVKAGRGYSYKWGLNGETVEGLLKGIKEKEERIAHIEKNWIVVELERK